MAKITSKASLVMGTNLKFHIADKGGTDISITKAGSILTIGTAAANFTGSSEVAGVVNRPIVIGDVVAVSNASNALNNDGLTASVTAVSATSITATILTGTGATEAAGADINIVAFKKTYEFLEAGGLSFVDGVAGIVLTSRMADLWDTSDFDKYDPAWTSVEPRAKSLANINGWEYHNSSTRDAIRDTSLEVRPSKNAAATKILPLLRSTSNAHAPTDQMTNWFGGDPELTAPNNFVMTGGANQLVLIYDYNNGAPIDKRGIWYTRLAVEGKTIIMEQHNLQFAEIIPISASNAIDPKLTVPDATIAAGGIYANIDYNLDVDGVFSGLVNGASFNFAGFVDGDNQTNEAVHQKINYLWRRPININSDGTGATKRGDKQPPLTQFSGDAFTVKSYLQNYKASQRNNLTLLDTGGSQRAWPAIYTLSLASPALAIGGTFSLMHATSHGTSGAVYLKNEAGIDQKDIVIAAAQDIVVAYSTYNVGGHTPNTPLPLILTWNKPSVIEPDNVEFTLGASNLGISITPTANPSYTVA
jgi:hypothetical protein